MIPFLTDEDFHHTILAGVRRRLPQLDIVRVQDVGLRTYGDPAVLAFAASQDRIVLSHDLRTMKSHASSRILAREKMPGLFLIRQSLAIAQAIDEIVLLAECSKDDEWTNCIEYLPL